MGIKRPRSGSCGQFQVVAGKDREILPVPLITPFMVILFCVSVMHLHSIGAEIRYLCDVYPQSKTVRGTALERKMIRIHGTALATVVTSFVCILVVHVIGDSDFCEYQWMATHVIQTFIAEELQLVTETVSDGCLANLNCKGRGIIFASKYANDIHIVKPVPATVSKTDMFFFGSINRQALTNVLSEELVHHSNGRRGPC